jgi:hypothetical protein
MEQCPGRYPQGSNLCNDYNILGMQWLVAAVGVYVWRAKEKSIIQIAILCIIIAAGLTVGSRRFILLLPLLIAGWKWITWKYFDAYAFRREIIVTAATLLSVWGGDLHGYSTSDV